ncbi:type III-B CRISPR module RAMP protein Cmr4 [Halomonas sp.]|uniref:type III-B CRISPR module RAMP protein Cmr4 n=1 Tax=Halomonas sp. TaxID=1486246 RepID=UPI00385030D4
MTLSTHRLLGLTTQTSLHAGSGSADEVIDLPIQREAHTDWPCVFGSSVKGALRARTEQSTLDSQLCQAIFGPDTGNASEHAGSLLVSDARLILLPVRSLTSHFRWVTCPALLRRLRRDLERLGLVSQLPEAPEVADGQALVTQATSGGSELYLEEYRFTQQTSELGDWLSLLEGVCGSTYSRELKQQLTVVDDDSFRHLCRSAMPVQPHIRLNNDTKTVANGALWYEENLPPETVLYVCLTAQPSRLKSIDLAPAALVDTLLNGLFIERPWLQLGGNETVGMGWCRVEVVKEVLA